MDTAINSTICGVCASFDSDVLKFREKIIENRETRLEWFEKINLDAIDKDKLKKQLYTGESDEDSAVNSIICAELLKYLFNCAEESLQAYMTDQKRELIRSFRKCSSTINDFQDIHEVFKTMCQENDNYKTVIFE